MAILTFPTSLAPGEMDWGYRAHTRAHASPLDETEQILSGPGLRWRCRLVYPRLSEDRLDDMEGFLSEFEGAGGRFYLWNFVRRQPRGAAKDGLSSPLVAGAGQTGRTLAEVENTVHTRQDMILRH